jgi:hypothetical protein
MSLLVVLSGIIAAGLVMVSGVGQMAFASDQTSAGSAATGTGSSSTGSGAASASIGPLPIVGTVTASGSGSSSTGSSTTSHASGGVVGVCGSSLASFGPLAIGGGCSTSP